MKSGERVVAVVPARGGYDEVPYMNIKKLGALPLIAHTLRQAQESRYIDRIIVSTDDDHVARVAKEYGAEVPFRRPAKLAEDIPMIKPVIEHAVRHLEEEEEVTLDVVVVLQATSPFRTASQIDRAIDRLFARELDSVISLREVKALTWQMPDGNLTPLFERPGRREDVEPVYHEDGAIWVMRRTVLDAASRLGERIGHVIMDRMSSFTVHDIYDFWLAEKLVRLPRILFRVDGGGQMGMGHVYRSLAVAEALRSISNPDVCFLMSSEPSSGLTHISKAGYPVRVLPGDASTGTAAIVEAIRDYSPNIIVNDLPFVEKDYLSALASLGASTINLVDSLADIEQPADIASVIISAMQDDQLDLDDYYAGPAFAILRESFQGRAATFLPGGDRRRRIVLSFGGSDPQGLTLKSLRALDLLVAERPRLVVTVVLGPAFSYRRELDALVETLGFEPKVLHSVEHMAEILSEADLVLCSGGMTVFEIAALGRPGVVLCQNIREKRRMATFAQHGSILHLGLGTEVEEDAIREATRGLLEDEARLRGMSEAGIRLVDARGAARVASVIKEARGRGPAGGGNE